jgi:hypothetical protein
MTTATIATSRFDMGRVMRMTFGAIGRNWLVFGLLTLLLAAAPTYLLGWSQARLFGFGQSGMTPDSILPVMAQTFMGVIISGGAGLVMQAGLVHGVVADLNGRKASFGDCLGTGVSFLLPVLGLGIVMGVAIVIGFLLFVAPGVFLSLMWIAAVPAMVVEGTGVFGAFSRSEELTRNHRWALLGLCVVYLIASWILSLAALGASGGFNVTAQMAGIQNPVSLGLRSLFAAVSVLVRTAGIAAIYYELRSIKEGIGPEALASVFD